MSKHSSLKATGTVGGKRSVLKRFERVKLLKERGEWKKGYKPGGFFLLAELFPLENVFCRQNKQIKNIR